jgi:hypothetical protein
MEIRPPSKATPIVYPAGIPKIDAGQGDASGDASLCSIEPLWRTHDQRAAYCLPGRANDYATAANAGSAIGRFTKGGRLH